jgi:CheY-like chemotaxis protein
MGLAGIGTLSKSGIVEKDRQETALSDNSDASGGSKTARIVYVEDNPANVRLLEFLIARHDDLDLTSAENGEEGVALIQETLPDLVLMDIGLPGIDGLEALRILKSDDATKHIPVIAISANAMPHDVEKGRQAGFMSYLTKPIDINELLKSVKEVLSAGN